MCSPGRVLAKDLAHEGTSSSLKMKGIHRITVNPLHVLTSSRFCGISGSVTEETSSPGRVAVQTACGDKGGRRPEHAEKGEGCDIPAGSVTA